MINFVISWVIIGILIGTYLTKRDLSKGIDYDLGDVIGAIFVSIFSGPLTLLFLLPVNKVILKGKNDKN